MKVENILDLLKDGEPIAINDKTFTPEMIEEVRLETGDIVYWVIDGGDLWLSVDVDSEEVILFSRIEEEVDVSLDSVLYGGEDYELSLETKGTVLEDGEEIDQVIIREFQNESGDIF
ncbi:hypothetical protein KJ766_01430, partial [Patescibacteria group bacterium]|nr:hypothetical protein [Patescibacteria group bacterium]